MNRKTDAYGAVLLAHHKSGNPSSELIERDDGYIDAGSEPGLYFSEIQRQWAGEVSRDVVD